VIEQMDAERVDTIRRSCWTCFVDLMMPDMMVGMYQQMKRRCDVDIPVIVVTAKRKASMF
jgi:DNA-binding response OmpR family regulator